VNEIRLQKLLSQAGVASRRAAEQLIADGRVTINGVTTREMGVKADPATDDVRVDGVRVKAAAAPRYILLNKPAGYVTTRSDPQRRPTVIDLLEGVRDYVYPVGRLDFDTEGLLLLTNDGDLAAKLTHPRHGVERTYEAHVAGVPDDDALRRLRRGIPLDGRRTLPAEVVRLNRGGTGTAKFPLHESARPDRARERSSGGPAKAGPHTRSERARERGAGHAKTAAPDEREGVLLLTIREGRNRQVRRMCEAVGHPVRRLKRTRIGPLSDRRLKPGEWRELSAAEVAALKTSAAATASDDGPAQTSRRRAPRGHATRPRAPQGRSGRS
jgi:23S rRNA pseudouridine2605 synthase